jgi:glycosyltransferase involved in cell wall biosynthesis
MKKFTIYTPVFNSAKYIHRVYDSLKKQEFIDFEWLIINDGSKDDSSEVIQELIKKCTFSVNFIDLKDNIGFNRSMNLAVKEAKGELFLISHADDEFTPDTLEIFNELWENMDSPLKQKVQGIKCNCMDQYGKFVGDPFPQDYWVADIFDLVYKHKIKGEKWGFIRTEIIRKFPFPENQKFTPEGVIWHRIYYKYPAVFINKTFRIYYINDNPASLSATTKKDTKFAIGKRMLPLDFINLYFKKINFKPNAVIIFFLQYWKYSFLSKTTVYNSLKEITSLRMRILSLFFLMPGFLLSKR